ncbi:MAG TPA: acyl-CoA desaturase [Pseudonocardiaceae bacterium]|jgi:stearoyl-CoA desaturase (delta-9 desaturase)|nr:acyl-CoA desaturase [Pseudonocardiaceae bacterium]
MPPIAAAPPATAPPTPKQAPKPITSGRRPATHQVLVIAFVIIPLAALIIAVPFAWGWGLNWVDVGMAIGMYVLTGLGVTVGYHRHFTHSSFKAARPLRIALAVAGNLSFQGTTTGWVADHRRHHAFSDRDGDPHSPWRFGSSPVALAKGFYYAHLGWLFDRDLTNRERFAPDLVADPAIQRVDGLFLVLSLSSLGVPALVGGLATLSWWGAVTCLFWAGLVRIGVLHHVTWSVNSICHMFGERPFNSRDKAANFWPLAVFSFGESWHNLHHADPTCARHGVQRGQIDISARIIWIFEKLGWATNVRWPTTRRLAHLAA